MSNRKRIKRGTIARLAQAGQDLDADFFDANPGQRHYVRAATVDELRARAFVLPKAGSN